MMYSEIEKLSFGQKIERILKMINVKQAGELPEMVKDIFDSEFSIVISFLNFQAMNLSRTNHQFYLALTNSDYLFRDGVGVELFQKSLSIDPGYNLNGTDFIPLLLTEAVETKRPIVLWGTSECNLESAKAAIEDIGGIVEDTFDGFQAFDFYIARINSISSDALVILGMGMPKQEVLSYSLKKTGSRIIVNGGAFIDFTSGNIKRAPEFFLTYKLEWLYRLLNEPRRLFKRTIIGGLWFSIYSCYFFLKKKIM